MTGREVYYASEDKKSSEAKAVSNRKPEVKTSIGKTKKMMPAEKTAAAKKSAKTGKAKPALRIVSKTQEKSMEKINQKSNADKLKKAGDTLFGLPTYEETAYEEYMNEEQRAHFREILQRWKRSLMLEVDRTMSHLQDEAQRFPDPSDSATQEEEFSLELRTRDRERKLIRKIDKALERIEQDNYGFCDACGIEIGVGRLEARPTATLCIDCKTLDEIKERQTRA